MGILRGQTVIRVNSILLNLGHVVDVEDAPEFFPRLLAGPAVVEFGALGDETSIALVMAFLVGQLVGHIEHDFRLRPNRRHILLIEEAHRLLSAEAGASGGPNAGNARGKSAEDLNTMLAECRKFGQGIAILDQRPSSLVGGVMDNAYTNVLMRLLDARGFEGMKAALNLDAEQERYARTRLAPGEAVVLDRRSGQPVLIRAPFVHGDLKKAMEILRAEWASEAAEPPDDAALLQTQANAVRRGVETAAIRTEAGETMPEAVRDEVAGMLYPEPPRIDRARYRIGRWLRDEGRPAGEAEIDAALIDCLRKEETRRTMDLRRLVSDGQRPPTP